jgi:glycosyltransferase involved in cell wall biosynthesis
MTDATREHESAGTAPDVSVVVPVFRNAETVRELRDRLARALHGSGESFEIVFVDDACPDGSAGALEELAREDARVSVLSLARNLGQHRATLAGLERTRGEWVVILDADLQDPPEAIPMLLARARAGADAVFAGRRGRYESAGRLFTSRLFKRLLARLCDLPPDAGMFVVLSRRAVTRVLSMGGRRPFVVAMIGCTGLPRVSIPVERAPRASGESAYGCWGRLRSGLRAIAWGLGYRIGLYRSRHGGNG